jgi:hypothetical protein
MGFLNNLFGGPKKREARDTSDAELNAIFVPLRDRVCDFKDATKISWTHILSAAQKISVRLFVQARGVESARRLYAAMIHDLDSSGGAPVSAHVDYSKPPIPPEKLAELNGMLWEVANQMIAKGYPVEHIAQAFSYLVIKTAEHTAQGDTALLKSVMAETARDLQSDNYGR